jgi:hypothetical protein
MPPPGYRKTVTRFKVEQILSPQHLKEYQELLKDPRTTIKKAHAWLLERGYKIGYAAVGRHRRRFDEDVVAVRKTAMLAEHFSDASRGGGLSALSDATVARFQQVLLERLLRMDKVDEPEAEKSSAFSSREWLELAKTIETSVEALRHLETMRGQAQQRSDKLAPKKRIDGNALSDKVRRFLGMPLPGEQVPAAAPAEHPRPAPLVPPGEN